LQQRLFANDRHNPFDDSQASLFVKLEKLDWGVILDNKSDGYTRDFAC